MFDLEKVKEKIELSKRMGAFSAVWRDLAETIAELERVNKMLCNLTPSGSEYYNDPDRCIECIKDRIATADRLAIAQARKNKEAIAE
jgi:hypothetical protein